MRFMYVDESGDPGMRNLHLPPNRGGPSPHYSLSGFIVPAKQWRNYLTAVVDIRRQVKARFGLPLRAELHAVELIHARNDRDIRATGSRIKRIELYEFVLNSVVSRLSDARVINIHLDKRNPTYQSSSSLDVEEAAWGRLLQRFNTYLRRSCSGEDGLVFGDETNELKVRRLLRKLRVFNRVPSHFGGSYSDPLTRIVEDPIIRESHNSWFIQIADLIVHALYQKLHRKGSLRRYNVDRLFDIVDPLLVKAASRSDPQGIVRL